MTPLDRTVRHFLQPPVEPMLAKLADELPVGELPV